MQQVCASKLPQECHQFLALTVLAYRPLSLLEYTSFSEELNTISRDTESDDNELEGSHSADTNWEDSKPDPAKSVRELVSLCRSFLTICEDRVYFVHQSAKDYLLEKQSNIIFPKSQAAFHVYIFAKSVKAMSRKLKRHICELREPGFHIESLPRRSPDPLATIAYSCVYWVDHLLDPGKAQGRDDVQDRGLVDLFLQRKCLYWIESVSLLGSLYERILAIENLKQFLQVYMRAVLLFFT